MSGFVGVWRALLVAAVVVVGVIGCGGDDGNPTVNNGGNNNGGNNNNNGGDNNDVLVNIPAVDPSTVVRSTFTDTRDGAVYKTVKIGEQTWMAENLNYFTDSSSCYDNADSNCVKYGRLYVWTAAKKACPAGWKLPDSVDWEKLNVSAGSRDWSMTGSIFISWYQAARKLKSTSGWKDHSDESANGTDDYGFSALPGGGYWIEYDVGETYAHVGERGMWWQITQRSSNKSKYWGLSSIFSQSDFEWDDYSYRFSVRCLKN